MSAIQHVFHASVDGRSENGVCQELMGISICLQHVVGEWFVVCGSADIYGEDVVV